MRFFWEQTTKNIDKALTNCHDTMLEAAPTVPTHQLPNLLLADGRAGLLKVKLGFICSSTGMFVFAVFVRWIW